MTRHVPTTPGASVVRQHAVAGLVIPGIIRQNGYGFASLEVYADGLVECSELLDLELFAAELTAGGVATSVPDGAVLDVLHLGRWRVAQGRWELTPETMLQRVEALVKQLNPRLENLYDCRERTTGELHGMRYSLLGFSHGRPTRREGDAPVFARPSRGDKAFILVDGERCGLAENTFLSELRIFANGTIELAHLPRQLELSSDDLRAWVGDGRLRSSLEAGDELTIHGLGAFTVAEQHWSIDVDQIVLEVFDKLAELRGEPSSAQLAREAYEAYMAEPSEESREALRSAYERTPEHTRRYLGDMDCKDIPIRMIIYGDQELEGWSHRLAATEKDGPKPSIEVPQPSPERELFAAAERFAPVCRAFIAYVDGAPALDLDERLRRAAALLADLYRAALELPTVELADDDADAMEDTVAPPTFPGFDEHELYYEVFDPYEESEAVAGSLSDDLLDIYRDLSAGLALLDHGHVREALWQWRSSFACHWGDHAVDALRALQRALHRR